MNNACPISYSSLISTSRDPSFETIKLAKSLDSIIHNSFRIKRGAYRISDLFQICKMRSIKSLIIIHEEYGKPNGILIHNFLIDISIFFDIIDIIHNQNLHFKTNTVHKNKTSSTTIVTNLNHNYSKIEKFLSILFKTFLVNKNKLTIILIKKKFVFIRNYIKYQKTKKLFEVGPRIKLKIRKTKLLSE